MDLHRTEPEYTMQAVVDRTGVPADTIRSWERRHGFPNPARDAQNQRLYSEQDIQSILRLKEQTALGTPVRDAVRLLPELSRSDPETDQTSKKPDHFTPTSHHTKAHVSGVDRLVDALLAFDGAQARSILQTEMVTQSPEVVAFASILSASYHLETQTAAGARYGQAFLRRILESLFHASDPETGHTAILLAGVPGCQAELLGLAHALAFSRCGYATIWLGQDIHLSEMSETIMTLHPLAVILIADEPRSVARATHWWNLLHDLPSLRAWTGRPFIASPHRPNPPAMLTPDAPIWLPPETHAIRIAADALRIGPSNPVQIVSNQ